MLPTRVSCDVGDGALLPCGNAANTEQLGARTDERAVCDDGRVRCLCV